MLNQKKLFSSESVSPGHPDKIADQISDAVLDALLAKDPQARVACEVMVKNSMVVVAGEIHASCYVSLESLVKKVCQEIGYTDQATGFDIDHFSVINMLSEQSQDIAQGVDRKHAVDQGAGDQGLMFGYATRETETFMPMAHHLATKLMRAHHHHLKARTWSWLRPDAKAQVALVYDEGKPVAIHNVVLSTQHDESITQEALQKTVLEKLILPNLPSNMVTEETQFFINPTGKFVVGGPTADCGLTGRKIIVDTYGGMARHGGGCFSGKDPSKVDRSGAYCARYIAKHIVAAGLADQCEVQLAYAIGRPEPTSIRVDTFGTGKVAEEKLEAVVVQVFPLTPYAMIKELDLLQPIYQKTAVFGHFGRDDLGLPWEKLDRLQALEEALHQAKK